MEMDKLIEEKELRPIEQIKREKLNIPAIVALVVIAVGMLIFIAGLPLLNYGSSEELIGIILTAVGGGMMLGTELLWTNLRLLFVHGLKYKPKKCYRKTRQRKMRGITLIIFGIVAVLLAVPVFFYDFLGFLVVLFWQEWIYLHIPFGGFGMGIGLIIFGVLLVKIGDNLTEEMNQNSS